MLGEKAPLMTASPASSPHAGFTPFVAMCFTVNYIMGTGFLTLPWAFNASGVVLGAGVLFLVCWLSDVAKNYVLETMARADVVYTSKTSRRPSSGSSSVLGVPLLDNVENGLPSKSSSSYGSSSDAHPLSSSSSSPLVRSRKFELIELCSMFLGERGANLYMSTLGLYMYGTLWAYTSVFANALSSAFPIASALHLGNDDYLVYVLIFALAVVPLTCMELKEQVSVQIVLSLCRLLMVVLMVGSVAGSMDAKDEQFDNQTCAKGADLFNISGVYKILPIAVYANIFHHSIPGLSAPVADKRKLGMIFGTTFAFAAVAYSSIAIAVSWYFGSGIDQSANLNWQGYHAGTGTLNSSGDWVNRSFLSSAVSYYILCFPATDVVSAFPLNGITLGNSLMGRWYGARIRDYEDDRRTVRIFRLIGCVPPIVGACFVRELGTITDYTGITGFAIAFVFPAWLHWKSREECGRLGLRTDTYYSSFASGKAFTMAVGGFGIFLVVFVFGSLVYEAATKGQ